MNRSFVLEQTRGLELDPLATGLPRSTLQLRIVGAFAAVYLIWGSTFLGIHYALQALPPFFMAGLRFLTAGIIMFGIIRMVDRSPLTRRHWFSAAWVGGLMLAGGNGLVTWAQQYVASGQAALFIATVPLWLILLDWLLFRSLRPTRIVIAGLAIGTFGLYLLMGPGIIAGQPVSWVGGAALLVSCSLWALGSLCSRRAELPKSVFLATAMQMIMGGTVLLGLGTVTGEASRIHLAAATARSWMAFGYLIVFGSIVALTCYVWLMKTCRPAQVATYAYVNPVIAVILGAAVADEPLTPRVLVAAAIIVLAVVLITASSAFHGRPSSSSEKNG